MFKKSRRKIVAAILSVLIMLLVGTFLIIYISSYVEMTGCPCSRIDERGDAVRQAVAMACAQKEKTVILVLGRGSEKYQKIGEHLYRYPTDSELLSDALSSKNLGLGQAMAQAAV